MNKYMCNRPEKRVFSTKSEADNAAFELISGVVFATELDSYVCIPCAGFHIGHPKKPWYIEVAAKQFMNEYKSYVRKSVLQGNLGE